MKIELEPIKEILKNPDKEKCYYLNKNNGEVFSLNKSQASLEEQEFLEQLEKNSEMFISIPFQYEHMEYEIMEGFVSRLPQGHSKKSLATIIQRIGAFTRFSQLVDQYGLREDWIKFQDEEYEKIVKKWCSILQLDWE